MIIRVATDIDQPAWDNYVLNHPEGLAYHQYAWRLAIEEAYRFRGKYLVAETTAGICGVFPLIDFKVPLMGRTLVSLPYCDVGGVLAENPETARALMSYVLNSIKDNRMKGVAVRTAMLAQSFGNKEDRTPGFNSDPNEPAAKVRMVLNLPGSSEELLTSFKAKLRSQIKKPMRDGLQAKLGGTELIAEFYRVFSENMRDLGSPVHSKKWINAIVSYFGDKCRVGVVYTAEGSPAAAGIVLLHNKTISIPWASSLRCFNRLNPNMFLYWQFLAFGADNGFERFDFGRSTPGEGTYRFKEQWGAQPCPLEWQFFTYDGGGGAIAATNGKGKIRQRVENVWSRLPVNICNVVGPAVRRYVSL